MLGAHGPISRSAPFLKILRMRSGSRFSVALGRFAAALMCLVWLHGHLHEAQATEKPLQVAQPTAGDLSNGARPKLRVCADPNNLPFSNRAEEGFENRLAELVAAELGRTVAYTWWPQRRGFVRNTLGAGTCDLVLGVPAGFELLETTRPYYRSSYVFVTRAADELALASLDDPALRRLRIGLHVIGDDGGNVPPAQALARRGIVENVRGYSIYGDYSKPNPPLELLDALATGEIDIAIAWGPRAGYFARGARVPLSVTVISGSNDESLPTQFEISMGVRRGDEELKAQLERILDTRASAIEQVLADHGVPLLPLEQREQRAHGSN